MTKNFIQHLAIPSRDIAAIAVVLSLMVLMVPVSQATSIKTPVKFEPLFDDGPMVTNKRLARLPDDPDASCAHPDISVKFNISPKGKVHGVRLLNPTQDYLYLSPIVKAMSQWKFKPKMKDGLADTTRNVSYQFRMKIDFLQCHWSRSPDTQSN